MVLWNLKYKTGVFTFYINKIIITRTIMVSKEDGG